MFERFTGRDGRARAIEELRRQPIIGGATELAEIMYDHAEVMKFDTGSIVIEESAPDNDLCFILVGLVSIQVAGREVAIRMAGHHVGEMAVLDASQPRSASAVAEGEVVIARVSATTFSTLAESHPRLWRNAARELAERLRQRNRFILAKNPRPVLFVGCSAESLSIGRAIQSALSHDPIVVKLWTDDIFEASGFPIESLERELPKADFAVLVLSPDDKMVSRDVMTDAPRDNLVFELGLFMGALGHSRTFLIHPCGIDIKIPTDLKGLTALTYKVNSHWEIHAAVAPACDQIRNLVMTAGPR